jgi:putative endonuclease
LSRRARGSDNYRRALRRGRRAETLAALYLRLKGYRIVARGYRTPVGEIDIIARQGRMLALVEVKYRPQIDIAAWSISPAQCHRIENAARGFLAAQPQFAGFDIRFDAMLMAPWVWPHHLADAWRS